MARFYLIKIIAAVVALSFVHSQDDSGYNNDYGEYADYQDYNNDYQQEDNLYYDFAEREQQKNAPATEGAGGVMKLVATGLASWIMGARFHSGRAVKDLKRKHKSEQKKLYSQYYNDVYKLGDQNNLLQQQIEELTELVKSTEAKAELEALQRDYDEFKQPDLDSDDRISRAEFNMYVKDYLSNYPGLTEKDYPRFEDFDHDGNGYVSFEEYSQQMAVQAEQAELEELYGNGSGNSAQKAQAYSDLARGAGGNKMY
eukprot:CAMPEP_0201133242 /NCGR_PEP_ID=MMETSP0850-20130426/48180_1 /ASSEMBLY_ACC=CAM_ASM_000622 /TAXON_ID=183588 /ORGANISM="Pseudo-nitzschia fraudulenta, Strain WWA7" /LENGTH=255 /DNA_ID=CAMNT_0047403817 /DNA_START=260 /DNA_END=1027 /DNA_ORIENTATION=+